MFRFAPARRREAETVDPPLTDLTAGEKVVVVGGCIIVVLLLEVESGVLFVL